VTTAIDQQSSPRSPLLSITRGSRRRQWIEVGRVRGGSAALCQRSDSGFKSRCFGRRGFGQEILLAGGCPVRPPPVISARRKKNYSTRTGASTSHATLFGRAAGSDNLNTRGSFAQVPSLHARYDTYDEGALSTCRPAQPAKGHRGIAMHAAVKHTGSRKTRDTMQQRQRKKDWESVPRAGVDDLCSSLMHAVHTALDVLARGWPRAFLSASPAPFS
jgi:hypothetical protein